MKALITSGLLTLCCIMLYSCGGVPLASGPSQNNSTYDVQYLFEHDGCKVYRFYDLGSYVYFTNCNNSITSIKNDSTSVRTVTISQSPVGYPRQAP